MNESITKFLEGDEIWRDPDKACKALKIAVEALELVESEMCSQAEEERSCREALSRITAITEGREG